MIELDLCSRKSKDERSGVATWTTNLILRSEKQSTNRCAVGFLSGKNKKNGVATQTRNKTEEMLLIYDEKMPKYWICQRNWEMRDEKINVDETPRTEKLCPRQRRQKMLALPAQTNDRKMNNEWWKVVEMPRKLSPRQQRQKMLSRGLTRQPSDRGLSLWSPIPPFKPVSRG